MQRLFHILLALIASASDHALAKHVRYLKEENRFLHDRIPAQIHTRPHERAQLLKFGRGLGHAIDELVTFRRWIRVEDRGIVKKPKGRFLTI